MAVSCFDVGGSCGRVFDGDSNGARNILLRYLTLHCMQEEEEQVLWKLGPLRALPASRERSLWVLSVCCHTLCSFVMAYDKFICKLKIKREKKNRSTLEASEDRRGNNPTKLMCEGQYSYCFYCC